MAAPSDLRTQIAADLNAQPGLAFSGWLSSDYRTDLDVIAAGTMRGQLQLDVAKVDAADSNLNLVECRAVLLLHYRLTAVEAEADYSMAAMVARQERYTDIRTWLGLAAVYKVAEDGPELSTPAQRDGWIISWAVEAMVQLQP